MRPPKSISFLEGGNRVSQSLYSNGLQRLLGRAFFACFGPFADNQLFMNGLQGIGATNQGIARFCAVFPVTPC